MNHRLSKLFWAVGVAVGLMVAGSVTGQTSTPSPISKNPTPSIARSAAKAKAAPLRSSFRTPWGDPDLQGIWTRNTLTPLERPTKFAGKVVLTPEENAQVEAQAVANTDADRAPREGQAGTYNEFWWDHPTKTSANRTSLIVDPMDGRVPPLTPEAQRRQDAEKDYRPLRATGTYFESGRGTDSYTDRSLWERCITLGLPRLGWNAYNGNVQIFQAPGWVAIEDEMIHEARIIPTDNRPHLNADLRQWLGDSRGHWEGNALVVDTVNFTDKTNFQGSTSNLHMIERLTRVDASTLDYEVTFEDPMTWTRTWTVDLPMPKAEGEMYEYACHEGNDAIYHFLGAARAQETAASAGPAGR